MPLYRDEGVVLRTIKLGEADRIVTILSAGRGKIRAVAKGVRKPGSRIGARLDPTAHVAFQCNEGRELDTVTQVETIDAFRSIREHYGCLTHAVAMLEVVDKISLDREPHPRLYRMLVGALRALEEHPTPLVATAFFWRVLALEGLQPVLDSCVRCGGGEPFLSFDPLEGGVCCRDCSRTSGRRIEPEVLQLLRYLAAGETRKAIATPPGPAADEAERLAITALEIHLERRLRSAALL
jgi:DNA repair protein RecO (recombination protein O)